LCPPSFRFLFVLPRLISSLFQQFPSKLNQYFWCLIIIIRRSATERKTATISSPRRKRDASATPSSVLLQMYNFVPSQFPPNFFDNYYFVCIVFSLINLYFSNRHSNMTLSSRSPFSSISVSLFFSVPCLICWSWVYSSFYISQFYL
jgi:hypothetical protein